MEWGWSSLAGFALGLVSSLLVLGVQRRSDEKAARNYAKKIVRSLIVEIEEGIQRAERIVQMSNQNKVSFSRIYTDLRHSTNQGLASKLDDPEVLILLHRIYYRFDLVNFNFEQQGLGPAAAFAKDYLNEMKSNLAAVNTAVAK
jgi:hypothetical protein